MACQDESQLSILKTRELLSNAQQLLREIEELLDRCISRDPANQRRHRMTQQECEACIEEDRETLVIEGFRFKCATSMEDLRRQCSEDAEATDGYLGGLITQGQKGQATGIGNNGSQNATN